MNKTLISSFPLCSAYGRISLFWKGKDWEEHTCPPQAFPVNRETLQFPESERIVPQTPSDFPNKRLNNTPDKAGKGRAGWRPPEPQGSFPGNPDGLTPSMWATGGLLVIHPRRVAFMAGWQAQQLIGWLLPRTGCHPVFPNPSSTYGGREERRLIVQTGVPLLYELGCFQEGRKTLEGGALPCL